MQFSAKVTNYQQNAMLNICDADILGKKLSKDNLKMHISESYYGEKLIEKEEATNLLQSSSIINMVGNETISLSISLGIGSQQGIKTIDDIPFMLIFKM